MLGILGGVLLDPSQRRYARRRPRALRRRTSLRRLLRDVVFARAFPKGTTVARPGHHRDDARDVGVEVQLGPSGDDSRRRIVDRARSTVAVAIRYGRAPHLVAARPLGNCGRCRFSTEDALRDPRRESRDTPHVAVIVGVRPSNAV